MVKAIVLYLPALHQGCLNFLHEKVNPTTDKVYLIGDEISHFLPTFESFLKNDIRAINESIMIQLLISLNYPATVLESEKVSHLNQYDEIIMLDEDVSYELIGKFSINLNKVKFEKILLRREKKNSLIENEVLPDRIISQDEFDRKLMSDAQIIAEESLDWWRQVGCIAFISDSSRITGVNDHVPKDSQYVLGCPRSSFGPGIRIDLSTALHAEASVISYAAREGISLKGAKLYVTTYPCPACAKLIWNSGIKEVYYKDGYSLLDAESIFKENDVKIVLVK